MENKMAIGKIEKCAAAFGLGGSLLGLGGAALGLVGGPIGILGGLSAGVLCGGTVGALSDFGGGIGEKVDSVAKHAVNAAGFIAPGLKLLGKDVRVVFAGGVALGSIFVVAQIKNALGDCTIDKTPNLHQSKYGKDYLYTQSLNCRVQLLASTFLHCVAVAGAAVVVIVFLKTLWLHSKNHQEEVKINFNPDHLKGKAPLINEANLIDAHTNVTKARIKATKADRDNLKEWKALQEERREIAKKKSLATLPKPTITEELLKEKPPSPTKPEKELPTAAPQQEKPKEYSSSGYTDSGFSEYYKGKISRSSSSWIQDLLSCCCPD